MEYIMNIKIHNAVSINLIDSKCKMCLLQVQVDIRGNGCVCIAIDSFAQRESGDKVGANNLPWSLRYGNWECSRFRIGNWFEALALLTASDIFVDEGMHE